MAAQKRRRALALVRPVCSNKGDLAIFKGTLKVLNKLKIPVDYVLDAEPYFPAGFFSSLGMRSKHTVLGSVEKNITESRAPENPLNYVGPVLGLPADMLALRRMSSEIGFLLHLGGSKFDGNFAPHVTAEIALAYYKKKLLNSKLILGGISIEGVSQSSVYRALYRRFMSRMDHVFVRDEISFSHLTDLRIPEDRFSLICDFAFWTEAKKTENTVMMKESIERMRQGKPVIGIAPLTTENPAYVRRLIELIKNVEDEGYSVLLVPTTHRQYGLIPPYDQNDYNFCLKLNAKMGGKLPIIRTEHLQPEEMVEIISVLDGMISFRMHGAVFGTLAGVPTVHIHHRNKGLGLFRTFFGDDVILKSAESFVADSSDESMLDSLDGLMVARPRYLRTISSAKEKSLVVLRERFEELGLQEAGG